MDCSKIPAQSSFTVEQGSDFMEKLAGAKPIPTVSGGLLYINWACDGSDKKQSDRHRLRILLLQQGPILLFEYSKLSHVRRS
jgi:hypothetical protein